MRNACGVTAIANPAFPATRTASAIPTVAIFLVPGDANRVPCLQVDPFSHQFRGYQNGADCRFPCDSALISVPHIRTELHRTITGYNVSVAVNFCRPCLGRLQRTTVPIGARRAPHPGIGHQRVVTTDDDRPTAPLGVARNKKQEQARRDKWHDGTSAPCAFATRRTLY